MAIDFKTFNKVAPMVAAVKKPILLRGRHGIGKSCVVYQAAAELGLPVVERRASQMTEGDLVGLPSTDGSVTRFCPPDWFAQACNEPVALFLDEVDRATTEVRQGIFELTDSRKLNGHRLHPETLVFAAVNGGEHGDQYQVSEMDPAELDRWTVFDIEPTVEDWLSWANENVHGIVWDFINNNRSHLEHNGDIEPNKVYPSRRSWDRLSECLTDAALFEEGADTDALYHLSCAFVGFEAAVSFTDFIKNYERVVNPEDILKHGKLEKVADMTLVEHTALIEKMDKQECFKEVMPEGEVANLAEYFAALPSEAAALLWKVIGEGHIDNTVALHQTQLKDGRWVSTVLAEIYTGPQES